MGESRDKRNETCAHKNKDQAHGGDDVATDLQILVIIIASATWILKVISKHLLRYHIKNTISKNECFACI